MVDTRRPGGPDDTQSLLRAIDAKLNSPEGTITELIREVRDAIHGTSEPNLRQSILAMQQSIEHEFTLLRQTITNEGGMGRGTVHPPDHGGSTGSHQDPLGPILTKIDAVLERLERATVAFEGFRSGGEGGGRGLPSGYAEREVYLSTTMAVRKLADEGYSASNVLKSFNTLLQQQMKAVREDFFTSLLNMSLHTTNVAAQLQNFHRVLRSEVTQLQTSGVFGSNALTPMEHFLEGPERLWQGILTESDSFRTALKNVHQALSQDMASPLAMTGRDLNELSQDFRKARENIREGPGGFNSRAWMQTEEMNKAITDMVEWQHRMGIQSVVRDQITEQNAGSMLNHLKVIAAMTGQTVAKLEEQLKQNRKQEELLVGMGRMTPDESKRSSERMVEVGNVVGQDVSKSIFDLSNRILGYGKTWQEAIPAMAQKNPEMMKTFQQMPGFRDLMFQFQDLRTRALGPGESEQQRTDRMVQVLSQLGPVLEQFRSMSALEQSARFGPMAEEMGRAWLGSNAAATRRAPDAEQQQRQQDSPTFSLIQHFLEIMQEQIKPFFGLPSALAANTAAIVANTLMLVRMGGLGLLGGIGGGGLGMLARAALPIAGGMAAAGGLGAAATYAMGGSTGAVVGSGVGGVAGGAVGAALGTLTDWFTGPFGTIIGGVVGSAVGGWIGSKFSSPAVGPGGPQVGTVSPPDSSDQVLLSMAKLHESSETQNDILGRIDGELKRQTGYLATEAGGSGGGGVGYGGRGLSSNMSSVAGTGRPNLSTPYTGPGV